MTITAKGEYRLGDLQQAMRAHSRTLYWANLGTLYFMVPIFLLLTGFSYWNGDTGQAVVFVAISVMWGGIGYYQTVYAFKRQFKAPEFRGEVEFTLTEEKLGYKSLYTQSETEWGAFYKWKSQVGIIIVYMSPVAYLMLPERFFSNREEYESAKALLARNVRTNR